MKEAHTWGAKDQVFILHNISENDKSWYLKNCIVFVFLSLVEGFGLFVIEVMKFGKSTLLSKLIGLLEVGGNVAYYVSNFAPQYIQDLTYVCIT